MKDNQKFLTGLIIGAAAGTALTIFLQGESGKKLIKSVKDTAKSTGDELKDGMSSVQSSLDKLFHKGKQFISELRSNSEAAVEEGELDEIFS
ncbi:YtxH domain-containing protein [Rhizosphaericola mali]|uniref:YtxH domain-containing protein n=1 Tax=Rhizosphaericola mali TaxID=2545455 RepID=A0A5P2G630_9BACT|nr:YtxH domain-containing protein [Rhizosphaericola mali]QES90118.1 YtxH domain-containing protein [Rhizosphaericola mali]